MPRLTPFKLINTTRDGVTTSIVEGEGLYSILFDGDPFNGIVSKEGTTTSKYIRTCFVHKAFAINRAKKLNKLFHCDFFTVCAMTTGETVYSENNHGNKIVRLVEDETTVEIIETETNETENAPE